MTNENIKISVFLNKFGMFIVYLLDLNNVAMDLLPITFNTHRIKSRSVIFMFAQLMFTVQCILYTTTDPLTLTLCLPSLIYMDLWDMNVHLHSTWRPLSECSQHSDRGSEAVAECSSSVNTTWYSARKLGSLSEDVKVLTSLPLPMRLESAPFLIRDLISNLLDD